MSILEQSGLSKKEIQDRVKETIDRMKGLINEETALYIIIKEMGLDSGEHKSEASSERDLNINEVTEPINNLCTVGRVIDFTKPRTFTRKNGKGKGQYSRFWLKDTTGEITVVLWDQKANYVEHKGFGVNELVRIVNGQSKPNRDGKIEIHVGNRGDLELNPTDVDYTKYPKFDQSSEVTKIKDISMNQRRINVQGQIILKPEPRIIDKPDKTLTLQKITIQDDSGSIPVIFWNEASEQIKDFQEGDTIFMDNLYAKPQFRNKDKLELTFSRNSSAKLIRKAKEGEPIHKPVAIKEVIEKEGVFTIQGQVTQVDDLKEITFKDNSTGYLLSIVVSDETEAIRVTFWRDDAELYSDLEVGDKIILKKVQIRFSSYSNRNEATFRRGSELIKDDSIDISETHELPQRRRAVGSTRDSFTGDYINIGDIDSEGFQEIKGFVAKEISRITVYEACTKCRRKAENCNCPDGPESLEFRQILNLLIDDGTGSIRTTFIGDNADKIIGLDAADVKISLEEDLDNNFLKELSQQIVGRDFIIKGRVKFSDYTNKYELVVNAFKEMDPSQEARRIVEKIEN